MNASLAAVTSLETLQDAAKSWISFKWDGYVPDKEHNIMSTKTIPLELIPQGWYMSWFMGTQAGFKICATLSDSSTTYVDNQCRQSTTFGTLAQGFAQVRGTNLQLQVDISSSHKILVVNHPVVVPNVQGISVAQGYVLAFEDSDDQDFNDLYVTIMAWKSVG